MTSPSRNSIEMIENFEIGGVSNYICHPIWPGGSSGVTVGVGYDLGYATSQQIAADWSHLPKNTSIKLQELAGIRGAKCQELTQKNMDIEISLNDAISVFETINVPRVVWQVASSFQNTFLISDDSFGALVSLVFNRGASMVDTQPNNRLEMRQIRDAMAAQEFAAVPDLIRSMKRLWQGTGLAGLLTRRDAEAALFERGLASQQS